jgi:hypothetical protein
VDKPASTKGFRRVVAQTSAPHRSPSRIAWNLESRIGKGFYAMNETRGTIVAYIRQPVAMRLSLRSLLVLLLLLSFTASGCFIFRKKATCPAYMGGAATGMGGNKGKSQQLFPNKMRKH